jgi:exodeoxyribonuclease VII small subunit
MPKSTKKKSQKDEEMSFEEALGQLEQLVEEMEQDQLPLEQLVEHYEKGSRLLKQCETILEAARKRLETITLQNQDTGESSPDENPTGENDDAPEPGDDDGLRLF